MPVPIKLPNSPASLATLFRNGALKTTRTWGMLALRSAASFTLLAGAAGILAARGVVSPFTRSAAWWLWYITAVNFLTLALLFHFAHKEGMRMRDLFYARSADWKDDLKWLAVAVAGIALFSMAPGFLLAKLLWGTESVPNSLLFGRLPQAAVYPLFLLLPVTQALAELPLYWGYAAPRLRAAGLGRWKVILTVGGVLSFQHLCFSFQPDLRYAVWLALKFLPFALWTGFIMDRRPTVLPYLMGVHLVMDASLPVLALLVSRGMVL